ncbi:MAG: aminoacyl-tRNA hydrolase [Candidatus Hydrogenedentes bacterium]|nr:aminoacyl-tRNA hydrolase [Candidatus Hydrogenedentota bacterium]
MKLIVGLGNPGPQYRNTRHNVGFRAVERVAEMLGVMFDQEKYDGLIAKGQRGTHAILLLKPMTYMNVSGVSVAAAAKNRVANPLDLLIVTDDINLPLGRLRLREKGSAGGHNGLKSIIERLGTDEFPRLRIGVGDKEPGTDLRDHVLSGFRPEEKPEVDRAIDLAAAGILDFVDRGASRAMTELNKRQSEDRRSSESESGGGRGGSRPRTGPE